MKISENWLREWVAAPAELATLADDLTMLGLEVDGVEPIGGPLGQVVVGRVLEVSPHPDADRLRVCRVDGGGVPLQVVCGAPNVRAGGRYPLALAGATLPGGQQIKAAAVRGVESCGMLCSAAELGLAGDHADGLLELDAGEPGQPAAALLALPDAVIDVNLTPNRADCFSVRGLARDLAARYAVPLAGPALAAVAPALTDRYPVEVLTAAACPHFFGRVIRGIDPLAPTPLWMAERLCRAGFRPIQLIVDVTNYVMLELGQPLHAYDLAALRGPVRVRGAAAGECIALLDGREVGLVGDELLITDDSGPIGLAGIMGGAATAVRPTTTDIFLESAHFSPGAIAGRARRHGLQTDASMRFERGVDPGLCAVALERATMLLLDAAGGQAGPSCGHGPGMAGKRATVRLRRSRLAAILGMELPDTTVAALLARLGMEVAADAPGWQVSPPSWRFDIAIEEDLVEEVARLHGYDQLPSAPSLRQARLGPAPDDRISADAQRSLLQAHGYQEVITYSFIRAADDALFAPAQAAAIVLANPISADMGQMRRSLWPGLLRVAQHNVTRQQDRVRIFEIGSRFIPQATGHDEIIVMSGLACGGARPEHWEGLHRAVDFHDIKGDIEALAALAGSLRDLQFIPAIHEGLHPGRSARIERAGAVLGWAGELHPGLRAHFGLPDGALLFELDLAVLGQREPPRSAAVSRFPATRRDIAVLVDRDLPVAELMAGVREAAGGLLTELTLFDVYRGKNIDSFQKSVALGLILQETSRTLTDQDVGQVMERVMEALGDRFGARIRE
jgi:phenylalanyl-tRNA synthetase beta chain